MKKKSNGEKAFDIFNIVILATIAFIAIYPLWHVLVASMSDNTEIMKHRGMLFNPIGFTLDAYTVVFHYPMVLKGYLNTIFIVVVGCTINILMTSIGAYVLSRKDVMFLKAFLILIIITMYFGGGLIPLYFTVKELQLDGTLWALIIPVAINTFYLIIMKTAFSAIPDSLEESAKIDGASHITILFRIVLPLSLPTIAVMLLYYGVGHWNSWFNAMIFLRTKRELYPLQLVLREILLQNTMVDGTTMNLDNRPDIGETIKYALIIVATVPVLFVYPFLQKYFVKGVLIGAVKE